MNKLQRILFKNGTIILCFLAIGVHSQKQTKTYKETFTVGDDAVLDINTSYADIEFETWDKNQVVVEATIELEGASTEEADQYFKRGGIKILGNSKHIEISTGIENSWFFRHAIGDIDVNDFIIKTPKFPELEPLFLDLRIPDIPEFPLLMEMPPMPHMSMRKFNYKAYKKDGEKYMKKWKKEFDENFDEDYKKRMEVWSERMKVRSEEWKKRQEELYEIRKERMEQREGLLRERKELRKKVQKERQEVLEERQKLRKEERDMQRSIIISRGDGDDEPNIFYRSSDGEQKKYKVKKVIKIKMPKSAKLKINVRHGEVKLAENTKNMNATLSYSRLLASTIEGDKTNISASYSPVTVQHWNYGKLKTEFSEGVDLKEVRNLTLYSTSSDVTIDVLLKSALIKNNLGALRINSISNNFTSMDISLQNGELICELPSTPYTIYVDGTFSKLTSPAYLIWDRTKYQNNTVHKGYHLSKNADKSIVINAQYSDVILEE